MGIWQELAELTNTSLPCRGPWGKDFQMLEDSPSTERGDKSFRDGLNPYRRKTKKEAFDYPKYLASQQLAFKPAERLQTPDQVKKWFATEPWHNGRGSELGYFTGRGIDGAVEQPPTLCLDHGWQIVTISIHVDYPYNWEKDRVAKDGVISDYAEELLDFCEGETLILQIDEQAEDAHKSWWYKGEQYLQKYRRIIWYTIVTKVIEEMPLPTEPLECRQLGIWVCSHGRRATIAGTEVGNYQFTANGTVLLDRVMRDIKTAHNGGNDEQNRQVS